MRDLTDKEIKHVYGAGGYAPQPKAKEKERATRETKKTRVTKNTRKTKGYA